MKDKEGREKKKKKGLLARFVMYLSKERRNNCNWGARKRRMKRPSDKKNVKMTTTVLKSKLPLAWTRGHRDAEKGHEKEYLESVHDHRFNQGEVRQEHVKRKKSTRRCVGRRITSTKWRRLLPQQEHHAPPLVVTFAKFTDSIHSWKPKRSSAEWSNVCFVFFFFSW